MKVSELIAHLQTHYSPEDYICAPIWQAGDVQQVAEDMLAPKSLNDDQISAVLNSMEKNHDACLGITWETIECAIQLLVA